MEDQITIGKGDGKPTGMLWRSQRRLIADGKGRAAFLRPCARMLRVTTTDPNLFVVAFAHPTMGAFTVVAINTSNTNKSLVLGGANVPTSFSAFRTSATENTVSLGTVSAPSITLRADSVTTLVNGNVFE